MVKTTPKYTPRQYLDGIRRNDPTIINSIVEEYLPGIRQHITHNNGTEQDAEDTFQEALISLFLKTRDKGLHDLTCTFYTFLFEICKRLWLSKLRKEKPDLEVTLDEWMLLTADEDPSRPWKMPNDMTCSGRNSFC
ncbi:MAG: hypothetical protein IPJ40_23940 [Saprospirales bacterium]|nr:hypothetical protein [Saprospirales bacterium]